METWLLIDEDNTVLNRCLASSQHDAERMFEPIGKNSTVISEADLHFEIRADLEYGQSIQ